MDKSNQDPGQHGGIKLSVVVPVYNEAATVREIIERVKRVAIPKEIILVDDGSTDGSRDIILELSSDSIRTAFHNKRRGKGAAIQTGLKYVTGDVILIQDADLEYNPEDYHNLIAPILSGKADIVFGSRFRNPGVRKLYNLYHYLGNKTLNFFTNVLFGCMLSDLEGGYKMIKREVMEEIRLRSNGFEIEAEMVAKILKRRYRIYECPISYESRTYEEGKKIRWRDGFLALYTLLKYRLMD